MAVLPLVALGVGLAGTGLSAFGQYRAGQAQKGAYDYSAKVAEAEAGVARAGAAREEEVHRAKLQRMLGTQRALYGAAGIDITSGSPLLTMMSTAEEGEREAEFIKYGGEVSATEKLNEARANRYYGKQSSTAGKIGAGSTFFTGLGEAGLGYAKLGKVKSTKLSKTGYYEEGY